MVVVVMAMVLRFLLDVAEEPAEDVASLVEQQPEGERVDQLEDEDLLDDQIHEVYCGVKKNIYLGLTQDIQ